VVKNCIERDWLDIFSQLNLNQKLWKAAKIRNWNMTGGLKCNRRVRIEDSQGIVTWPTISEYAATLSEEDIQALNWPSQEGE
jgi:hypothetical protein